jgi:hypothetical protein
VDGAVLDLDAPSAASETKKREGRGTVKALYVRSGTGIKDTREWAPSANETLRTARTLMKLRRPGVRIQGQHGNPVSFFELKLAQNGKPSAKGS